MRTFSVSLKNHSVDPESEQAWKRVYVRANGFDEAVAQVETKYAPDGYVISTISISDSEFLF